LTEFSRRYSKQKDNIMQGQTRPDGNAIADYQTLFVNRGEYTVQLAAPKNEGRSSYYYRPRDGSALSPDIIRRHLEGQLTVGLYAINPDSQRCKWVAIDADYDNALHDLLKLQWELRQDGVESALERSRRGGHLWIFAAEPLLARDCRAYVHQIAHRLRVCIKGESQERTTELQGCSNGIEVFPKQDVVPPNAFGNAIRGPLGVHRAVGRRYWFYGADYNLQTQLDYLKELKKLTEKKLADFLRTVEAAPKPSTQRSGATTLQPAIKHWRTASEFSILAEITGRTRKIGRNYFTRCPSCARQGRDRHGDNLAVSAVDPRKYRCWAGCTKEQIRDALGRPIIKSRYAHGS
jgi:hypothetical protein